MAITYFNTPGSFSETLDFACASRRKIKGFRKTARSNVTYKSLTSLEYALATLYHEGSVESFNLCTNPMSCIVVSFQELI